MDQALENKIKKYFRSQDIPVIGAARAEDLNQKAPLGFRPEDMLKGAKTVLVLGKPLPLAVFLTEPHFKNLFYVRSFDAYYGIMDAAANTACLMMEEKGHLSLPLPSYSPIRFHDGEPRGVMSLKHAAAEAGLGKMGKNTLLIHPKYGNILRFGGLVTTMEWPWDGPGNFKALCPDNCRLCEKACPVGALNDGSIDKTLCMGNCVKHVMMPSPRLLPGMKRFLSKSRRATRLMELFTYNMFGKYGIDCVACLKACPHFPGKKAV